MLERAFSSTLSTIQRMIVLKSSNNPNVSPKLFLLTLWIYWNLMGINNKVCILFCYRYMMIKYEGRHHQGSNHQILSIDKL